MQIKGNLPDTLHTVWSSGALLGIRCTACDHRAVLSPAELPTIRRENTPRLRDINPALGFALLTFAMPKWIR